MIPLSEMNTGDSGKVAEIRGGHGMIQRLAGMGVLQGTEITIIQAGGPVILEALGNRLVIGRGMVNKIMVEPSQLTP